MNKFLKILSILTSLLFIGTIITNFIIISFKYDVSYRIKDYISLFIMIITFLVIMFYINKHKNIFDNNKYIFIIFIICNIIFTMFYIKSAFNNTEYLYDNTNLTYIKLIYLLIDVYLLLSRKSKSKIVKAIKNE